MPRTARETSQTGIYHAILRGVNKQQIFECHEDYEHFIQVLQRQCGMTAHKPSQGYSRYTNYELLEALSSKPAPEDPADEQQAVPVRHCYIYAYCLMGNHVHLLLKGADEEIGEVMKRITSSYVYYYNHKYGRIGHLFQERFKSQPVEDWEYFLTLLRYIHQNPLKPQLVTDLRDYHWSSWREYLGVSGTPFCSTTPVLSRISIEELSEIVNTPLTETEEDLMMDYEPKVKKAKYTDREVWEKITEYCGSTNSAEFQALKRPYQKHIMYYLHEQGVGARTIARLTGVTYSIVQKATNAENEWRYYQGPQVQDGNPEDEEYLSYLDTDAFSISPDW